MVRFCHPDLVAKPGTRRPTARDGVHEHLRAWDAPHGVALVVVLGIGVVLRVRAAASNSVTPDALGFLDKARVYSFTDPWPAGEREPLWIAFTKLFAAPFGYAPGSAKGISLLLAVALLLACAALLRRHMSPVGVVAATAFLAVHPALLRDASNGIREPAAMLLLLLAGHFWVTGRNMPAAVAAGVLVGVRWELGLLALSLLVAARIGWRPLAAGIGTALLLMAPFVVANARAYDDPMYHSSYHALYYRNLEAAARAGIDPYSLDRYRGEPLAWSEYYLEFLGPGESVERVVRGWPQVITAMAGGASKLPSSLHLRIGLGILLAVGIAGIFAPQRRLVMPSVLLIAGGAAGYAALYRWMEYRLVSFLVLPLAVLLGLFADMLAGLRRNVDVASDVVTPAPG